jgi:hypothetical protein
MQQVLGIKPTSILEPNATQMQLLKPFGKFTTAQQAGITLAAKSLVVMSFQTLGPAEQDPQLKKTGGPKRNGYYDEVSAVFFLKYQAIGSNPKSIKWIQFVYTNAPSARYPQNDWFLDNEHSKASPYYQYAGNEGFQDAPTRSLASIAGHGVKNLDWKADVFPVEELCNGDAVILQGVHWGFRTANVK